MVENKAIIYIQDNWDIHSGFASEFMQLLLLLMNKTFTLYFSLVLFLVSDSLIAFKSTLLYSFGLYIMVYMKLIYESARPYWVADKV